MTFTRRNREVKRFKDLIQILESPTHPRSREAYREFLKLEEGIGDGTIDDIISASERLGQPIHHCLLHVEECTNISSSRAGTLKDFGERIGSIFEAKGEFDLKKFVDQAIEKIRFYDRAVREEYREAFETYIEDTVNFTVEHGDSKLSFLLNELQHRRDLYTETEDDWAPNTAFNARVVEWLKGERDVREHTAPAAFEVLRQGYEKAFSEYATDADVDDVHRALLSTATNLMDGVDLGLGNRLSDTSFADNGIRSPLSQGQVKNRGENFVNLVVYVLASRLIDNDRVLVDKGTPPPLRDVLRYKREASYKTGSRKLDIPIECDFCVFSREDPTKAIIFSSKTRMKEVAHIVTMWKLFFDMLGDKSSLQKWGLEQCDPEASAEKMEYVFATSDGISGEAEKTQGGDVEREQLRNLIAADVSFLDYAFVSKTSEDISHVAGQLKYDGRREAAFHELGCVLDLIEQKFDVDL